PVLRLGRPELAATHGVLLALVLLHPTPAGRYPGHVIDTGHRCYLGKNLPLSGPRSVAFVADFVADWKAKWYARYKNALFFRCFSMECHPHTVEVTGSNPVPPIDLRRIGAPGIPYPIPYRPQAGPPKP